MEFTGGQTLRRKYIEKGSKIPKIQLTKDNSVLIFPFELTMGFITSTENGIRNNDSVNVFDYSTFQRIFTGLENVLAQWEGAYEVTKAQPTDTFLTKAYKVGRSFQAYIPQEQMGASFEPSTISGDFLAEFTEETFTIHTYEDIQETDLFKLYIIPELKENKWLFVQSATKYFLPNGKLHHVEITLETLNNRIAKSGKAIEEFIQRSAPGEGYAFPVVDNDQNVSVDEIRKRDVPVNSIQIEGAGAIAMGTIYCYGRPTIQKETNGVIESTFNPKIQAPRLLLPLRMETPLPSPVNTKPTSETDWLVGKFRPTLSEDFKDWKEQVQASYDLTQRAIYEGVLKSVDNENVVQGTNGINQGTRNKIIWDVNWRFAVNKTYNTATDALTDETLTLNGDISLPELFCHNIFGLSAYTSLPLSVTQNIAWSLRSIPAIGGFLSKLTLGIPIGWTNTAIKVKMDDVLLTIPASLADYANVLIKDSDKLRIDLNTFTDEAAQNEAIDKSGIKATGSLFKVSLTDRFEKTIDGEKYIFNTISLGQDHPAVDDNGKVVANNPGGKLKWDNTCKPAAPLSTTPGYVIDISTFKAIAKMDVRTTFFNAGTQVWSGTHLTTSKFTGSIRDWTNAFKYSNWKEDNGEIINYPAEIVAPKPPTIQNPILHLANKLPLKINLTPTSNEVTQNTVKNGGWDNYGPDRDGTTRIFFFGDIETQPNQKLAIDLNNYGGAASFKQNYESISIEIFKPAIPSINQTEYILKQNITISMDALKSSEGAKVNFPLPQVDLKYESKVTDNTGVRNETRYMTLYSSFGLQLKAKIVGNNLEFWTGDIKIDGARDPRLDTIDYYYSRYNNKIVFSLQRWGNIYNNLLIPANTDFSGTTHHYDITKGIALNVIANPKHI